MSRFYASIQGNSGEATRCGASNITGHVRGWHLGVRVDGDKLASNPDSDCFVIYATSGSSGGRRDDCLGSVRGEGGRIFRLDDRLAAALGLPRDTEVNLNDLGA